MDSNRCRVRHALPRRTLFSVADDRVLSASRGGKPLLVPARETEVFQIVVSPEYLAHVQALQADKRPRVALRAR